MRGGADDGMSTAVKSDKIIIGRHPAECTLVVPAELTRVSRVHAAVYPVQEDVYVEDLNSRNGTYIDGVRVTERARLQPGQHLLLGGGAPFSKVCVLQFMLVPSSTT
jgi:pSer/pThr/pTyr-binding forkhead associated (FHA) protein